MIQTVGDFISLVLGLNSQQLSLGQMGLRAAVIYVAALLMVRVIGDRRFIGKHAGMDVLLGVILGSTLSRAINGSSPFFETIGAALVLVGMHRLFATLAFHYDWFDALIKGHSRIIIRDGQIHKKNMQKSHISNSDLEALLLLKAQLTEPNQVQLARLERSGEVSIIPQEKPPQIIELAVEAGVKKVQIYLQ